MCYNLFVLKILSAPNPVLSQSAKRIYKVDNHVRKIIGEMEKALLWAKDPAGVGLAAPQVGRSLQIFIAKPAPKSKIKVFINPKIIETGGERGGPRRVPAGSASSEDIGRGQSETGPVKKGNEATKLEGCLSLPNIWGEVQRAPFIKISYMDEKGERYSKEFRGFIATIIQHEMDHLNGVLFPKRVLEQKGSLYKSHKNEKGEDVFEEIEI
jgi:peptide deformylase